MKRKTKIIGIIFMLILVISIFSITVCCTTEESEAYDYENISEDFTGEASEHSSDAIPSSKTNSSTETEYQENPFALLYKQLLDNSDKLLSALAFIGTLLITITYKRGLLPIVEKSLNALSASLSKVKEEFKQESEENSKFATRFEKAIENAERSVENITSVVEKLEGELENSKASRDACENFEKIFLAELEILYDAFISSSISQYQKDRMSDSIAKLKERIENAECEKQKI